MMVMRRREGEKIVIGDDITIHIAHIGRTKVKIAIQAPREVSIVTEEVKIVREENIVAASVDVELLRRKLVAQNPTAPNRLRQRA